jgi:hypothetical protein
MKTLLRIAKALERIATALEARNLRDMGSVTYSYQSAPLVPDVAPPTYGLDYSDGRRG